MTIPARNIKKPANPVRKEGFPENRIHRKIDGKWIKIGSVITVGTTDNWWNLAKGHQVRPWEIIEANFETSVPEEVNWYLREYVGCTKLGPRGRNYRFEGANPGRILMPFGEAVNEILIRRANRPEKKPSKVDQRWEKKDEDLRWGDVIVERMTKQTYREVQKWKPNPKDFDVGSEIKDMIFGSPGTPSVGWGELVESVVKGFNETHPIHQEVARTRSRMFAAYAAGVGDVLFPGTPTSMSGKSGYERVFYSKGRGFAEGLNPLHRYRFIMALAERDRHYGLRGFTPLEGNKYFFNSHYASSYVERSIRQIFTRNKYRFRNLIE